jgi:hypothetical protein
VPLFPLSESTGSTTSIHSTIHFLLCVKSQRIISATCGCLFASQGIDVVRLQLSDVLETFHGNSFRERTRPRDMPLFRKSAYPQSD